MKLNLLAIGLFAALCVSLSLAQEPQGAKVIGSRLGNWVESARARFLMPNIFDYAHFKQLFKKSYSSLLEDLARKRLFIGRAFRVFISAISYKHRKSSSYLSINQMSDWTPEELDAMYMKPEVLAGHFDSKLRQRQPHQQQPSNGLINTTEIPAADLEDVKQTLGEILDDPNAEPAYKEIAAELSESETSRKKRNALKTRDLSLEDLAGKPQLISEPSDRVASNNPNYEEPELTSFGLEDGRIGVTIPIDLAGVIKAVQGNEFLGSVLKAAGNFFNPQPERPEKEAEAVYLEAQSSALEDELLEEEETDLEDEVFIDHRDSGCLFVPRDQGKCGSCYSFATIALYEWLYCKATRSIVAFSEQYVVDCGYRIKMNGCNGAWLGYVSDFVQNFGLELRLNYPYRQREDHCPYDRTTPQHKMGYLRVQDSGFLEVPIPVIEHFLQQTPLVVNIHTYVGFPEYGGGVAYPDNCDIKRVHSVLIIGSGREDGEEYWLIRNSHSVAFGEGGHYKLNKKATDCITQGVAFKLSNFAVPKPTGPKDVSSQVRKRYNDNIEEEMKTVKKVNTGFFQ